MILGEGYLADGARETFGDVPFCWVLHPDRLPEGFTLELPDNTLVVVSTPILVGTIARLEGEYPQHRFAYAPENVRAAHPKDWLTQARFVIGTRSASARQELAGVFQPACFMSPESAEMVKHAINGFLALSVVYANEIARVGAACGADPDDVACGLMSDPRIGGRAYLKPAGGVSAHLQREVDNLKRLGAHL